MRRHLSLVSWSRRGYFKGERTSKGCFFLSRHYFLYSSFLTACTNECTHWRSRLTEHFMYENSEQISKKFCFSAPNLNFIVWQEDILFLLIAVFYNSCFLVCDILINCWFVSVFIYIIYMYYIQTVNKDYFFYIHGSMHRNSLLIRSNKM